MNIQKATKMGQEQVNTYLTEDLLEEIIVLMPFPAIFKARCLSKSWRTKLSSIKINDDDETKYLKTKFQNKVGAKRGPKWSSDWGTFCPVCLVEKDLFAYDRVCQLWRRMRLPKVLWTSIGLQVEGALVYGFSQFPLSNLNDKLFVANIFRGAYKRLWGSPRESSVFAKTLVNDISTGKFKVILLCRDSRYRYFAKIFDAYRNVWWAKELIVCADIMIVANTAVYLNGVFYVVDFYTFNIIAFNVDEGTVKRFQLPLNQPPNAIVLAYKLVACNGNLLTVIVSPAIGGWPGLPRQDAFNLQRAQFTLIEIDLGSMLLLGVAYQYTLTLGIWSLSLAVGDGDYIFLSYLSEGSRRMLLLNMVKDNYNFFAPPDVRESDHRRVHWMGGTVYIT